MRGLIQQEGQLTSLCRELEGHRCFPVNDVLSWVLSKLGWLTVTLRVLFCKFDLQTR